MASVSKRTTGGRTRWDVRYRDETGRQRSKSFLTEEHAKEWAAHVTAVGPVRAFADLYAVSTPADQWSFGSWLSHYVDTADITAGTRENYSVIVRAVARRLAVIPLRDVTQADIRAHAVSLAKTRKPETVRSHVILISAAMNCAVREGHIPRNPARGVKVGKRTKRARQMTALTTEEVRLLLGFVPEPYRLFVRFLLSTGLRFGEATALTVADFTVAERTVTVNKAWTMGAHGTRVLGPPKSEAGYRTVVLPAALAEDLANAIEGRERNSRLFVTVTGVTIKQQVFYQKVWAKVQKAMMEATGKHVRVHDLRHTWVSLALQKNTLHAVSKVAGHSSVSITADVYGHLLHDDAVGIADSLAI